MTDKGVEAVLQQARFYRLCEKFLSRANNNSLEEKKTLAKEIGTIFEAVVDSDRNSQGPVNREKYRDMLMQLKRVAAVSSLSLAEVVPDKPVLTLVIN
ncbi:MAG: hypothetical protein JNL76_03090 [Alphaproteobacteria bacterium]|nr:hypothetical protein [Alphaproteobacteria bacterium]